MPESAPLDITEATVGYELDAITLRNIASVRYVRHHEWLDHVLGSPLPTSAIVPPKVESSLSLEDINAQIEGVEAEIASLEAEKAAGWKFHVNEEKAKALSEAIHRLRSDFGTQATVDAKTDTENVLGLRLVSSSPMRPVKVTYDRNAVDTEQARQAQEKQQARDEESHSRATSSPEAAGESVNLESRQPSPSGLVAQESDVKDDSDSMQLDS